MIENATYCLECQADEKGCNTCDYYHSSTELFPCDICIYHTGKRSMYKRGKICHNCGRELEETISEKPKSVEFEIRKQILQEAEKCICTDRNDQYGSAEDNFWLISKYWNIYLKNIKHRDLNAHDIGVMMALFKIARLQTGTPKEDSYVDICGYVACAGEIALKDK